MPINYQSKISDVDKLKEEINSFRPFSSNALEGNSLTESETKVVIENGLTIGGKRTSRLVMNLALLQAGYPIAIIPPVLRSDYIYLISLANKGDCEQFFNFISSVEYESAKEYLRMIRHFQGVWFYL
jgi:Fic family protein